MLKLSKKSFILGCLILFLFSACGEYELLEHERACKRSADSLYRAHLDSLNTTFDSICVENSEAYYDKLIDSLKRTRIEDINRLFKKD